MKSMMIVRAVAILLASFALLWLCAWVSVKQEQRRREFITACVFDGVPLVYCEEAFKKGEHDYKPIHAPFSAR